MKIDDKTGGVTWAHVGDLHITAAGEPNYQDFLSTVASINEHLAGQIDFCVLPGDNANEGLPAQYTLIRQGLDRLKVPVHVIPGDHDRQPGDLAAFYQGLGVSRLPYAVTIGGHRCLFLDVVSQGTGGPDFALGADQLRWLESELSAAGARGQAGVVFMHTYPADLKTEGAALQRLFHEHRIVFVDLGHTHYNELGNDGTTIFAATRSTGQIEEGPVGFSMVCLAHGVVSWRFKPLHSSWPFVMITSPADHRLQTDTPRAAQRVSGSFRLSARVFGSSPAAACRCQIDGGAWAAMSLRSGEWRAICEAPAQQFTLTVEATDAAGRTDVDTIVVAGPGYRAPRRCADGSDADTLGAWPERHLLGTRLGPNRNGRQWP